MGSTLSKITDEAFRVWFASTFVVCVLMAFVATRAVHLTFFWLSKEQKHMLCRQIGGFTFRTMFLMNPHIKIVSDDDRGLDHIWDEMCAGINKPGSSAPFIMMNHTSMLDGLLYSASMPLRHIHSTVTMAKLGLFKLPIFGQFLTDCGHHPVYFNSKNLGNFSVDKEKQTQVMEKLDNHIENGGALAFYPEGQINRTDSSSLQGFRRGGFSIAKKHGMTPYAFLHTGVDDCWPTTQPMGGFPGTIRVTVFKVPPHPDEDAEPAEVADHYQKEMQKKLDEMNERAGKTNLKSE